MLAFQLTDDYFSRPATIVYHDDVDSETRQGPEFDPVRPRGTFDCAICFENQSGDNGLHMDQCGHRFCKSCIRHYLSSALSERRYPIICPLCVAEGASSEHPGGMSISNDVVHFVRRPKLDSCHGGFCPSNWHYGGRTRDLV